MKRIKKKYLDYAAVLLAALLTIIAGSGFGQPLCVNAAQETEEAALPDGVVAQVTFTNAPSHQPDLYISKKVTCSDPEVQIPDTTFTFEVEVDGVPYAFKPYKVLDSNGNEISAGTDEQGNALSSRMTDRYGTVLLKAGQTALFPYVGVGKRVKVTEVDLPDGFKVQSPAGAEAEIKSLSKDGAAVTYVNLYTPPSTPDGKKGSLKVEKQISWPEGYTYQAQEEPVFEFTLTLDGSPARDEVYDLYKISTGESELNAGRTDSEGKFSIPAGYYAAFNDLKGDVDYKVEESAMKGWHEVAAAEHSGSTSDNNTEIFYNTNASFSVKKVLTKGTSDTDFTFQLLDGKGSVWAGAEYWLYSSSGERIIEEEEEQYRSYFTDAGGQFTLKQNQVAVFVGIDPGTVYSVKELVSADFVQVIPLSAEGYLSEKVKDGGAEILLFENTPLDPTGNLTVTKKLKYEQDAPLKTESFTFRLCREASQLEPVSGKVFLPVIGASYTIGDGGKKYVTNEEGIFTLKANETAVFDRLALNAVYQVEELVSVTDGEGNVVNYMPAGYAPAKDSESRQSGTLTSDGLQFTYENTYTAKHLKLKLIKYSTEDGKEIRLDGAVFGLYRDAGCEIPAVTVKQDDQIVAKEFITATVGKEKGTVIIDEDLREGTYYLRELAAPEGYALLSGTIKLDIKRTVDENGRETFKAEASSILDKADWEIGEVDAGDETDEPVLTLRVCNDRKKLYNLPSTGGIGTYLYTVIGVAVFMTAAFQVIKSRKSRRNQ